METFDIKKEDELIIIEVLAEIKTKDIKEISRLFAEIFFNKRRR